MKLTPIEWAREAIISKGWNHALTVAANYRYDTFFANAFGYIVNRTPASILAEWKENRGIPALIKESK